MATRSAIGIKHGDTVKAVYCHWDGYPEGVGATLLGHYSNSVKLNKLISLGDMSSLGEEIGEKHDFDNRSEDTWTTFYGRDRGEKGTEFRTFLSEESFLKDFNAGEDYSYLYDSGVWYVSAYGREFEPLHEVLDRVNQKEEA